MIELSGVDFSYGNRRILSGLSARFEPGRFHGIFGPNGGGKSTLLKLLTGELKPEHGTISPVWPDPLERAKHIAFAEQEVPARIPLSVREVVALGRYPWRRDAERPDVVERALEALALSGLAERAYSHLSGGERQRVMLARAMAQETPVLLLDEPASSLDIGYRHAFYRLLRTLAREGKCVVMVSHDLFIAPSYLDAALLLAEGRALHAGAPGETLSPEHLRTAFRLPPELG